MSIYLDLFFNKNVCIPGTCTGTCTCELVNLETFTNTQRDFILLSKLIHTNFVNLKFNLLISLFLVYWHLIRQ